ncbi:MAG: DUF3656 domain-containing protein [Oscillospiraceae bacterium]|nr:DUF3656 domain-containing protein [Oscillospiraceae bacterium]
MIELLAPAGSPESLSAALRCGANAVYVGGKNFSARQNAANFDMQQMKEAAELCHLYNAKLYIAINTIITDNQIETLKSDVKEYAAFSPDAYIVQDLGAARIIKSITPDIPVHASTQMTIHTLSGALLAKELGFTRVVLARETDSSVIAEIAACGIETEVFVHGALCMSVSGQCYMSAAIGSRSANRGLCAQSCRLPFTAASNPDEHCLSLKDLSLTDHVAQLMDSNVTSLKIEGRMKRPEYVACTVSAYRDIIDGRVPDMETLNSVFSRSGFTDGYYTGKLKNMFGMRTKDDVLSSKNVLPQITQLYRNERKIASLDMEVSIRSGTQIKINASDSDGYKASVSGPVPQNALNKPVTCETVTRQLSKLGDTIYCAGKTDISLEENLSVPVSAFNAMRRELIDIMYNSRKARPEVLIHDFSIPEHPQTTPTESKKRHLRIRIDDLNRLPGEIDDKIQHYIVPVSYLCSSIDKLSVDKDMIIAEPPRFLINEKEIKKALRYLFDNGIRHIMCTNVCYIRMCREIGFELHGDFGLNISNSISADVLSDLGLKDITASFELKLSFFRKLKHSVPAGIMAYGHLPLMLTRNCPVKNSVGCSSCRSQITDRTGRKFPVKCSYGCTEIFNPDTLYLADKPDELIYPDFLTLYFTDESRGVIKRIIDDYVSGSASAPSGITRGLYFRGVV